MITKWILFLISFLSVWTLQAKGQTSTHVLSPGQIINLSFPPSLEVSVTQGDVIQVMDKGSKIQVLAKKVGESEIYVAQKSIKVYVLPPTIYKTYKKLEKLLSPLLGPKLEIQQGKILISGFIYRLSDILLLGSHMKFDDFFSLETQLDPDVQQPFRKHIQSLLKKHNIEVHHINTDPYPKIYLESHYKNSILLKSLLAPYGLTPEFVEDSEFNKKMVRVHIVIAEVSKSYRKNLGLQWQNQMEYQLLPTNQSQLQLSTALQALEQKGEGQILASPHLLCRSGQKAEFLAGGEFPLKVFQYKQQDVIWKRYGILLSFEPQVGANDTILMKLTTEVSAIDPSQAVNGIPGLKTNRIQTHFQMKPQQTLLLSGLIKENKGHDTESLPYLSAIPILGHLFKSHNFLNQKSELLIFVQPEIESLK